MQDRKVSFHLWWVPSLFAVEYVALALIPHQWFTIHSYRGAPIAFGLALLFFGRSSFFALMQEPLRFSTSRALLHVTSLSLLLALQTYLAHLYNYGAGSFPPALGWLWLGLIPVVIGSLPLAFVPLRKLILTARRLGSVWVYAALCCLLVVVFRGLLAVSWDSPSFLVGRVLQDASFHQVAALLTLLHADPISDPATHVLGTSRFVVQIASSCSGIEGLALVSVLTLVWLFVERRRLRIGRALLLVPLALCLMWGLNVVRLAVLIGIGSAGHPDVALNGFHSQAGWIFFNIVSFGFLLTVQRVPWFRRNDGSAPSQNVAHGPARNASAIYLAPFLAITAASLVSQAATGSFEWLYPLRLLATLAVLWFYRREYRKLDWHFGWLGPVTGLGIAVLWIALHYGLKARGVPGAAGPGNALATGLSALPPLQRVLWIFLRSAAAVITVPIAEELAFRGFVARRLMSADVESVQYAHLTAVAIAGSAILFGVLHGQMWLAGSVAGIAFALVAKQRGRLGEAVAAHAVANLAITVVVLFRGDFTLWS